MTAQNGGMPMMMQPAKFEMNEGELVHSPITHGGDKTGAVPPSSVSSNFNNELIRPQ